MSSCPFTRAFHCSLGWNSEAPGWTWILSPTLAFSTSRAMIWTISSRASPLPPGNWCDAFITISAEAEPVVARAATPAASASPRSTAGFMRVSSMAGPCKGRGPGPPVIDRSIIRDSRYLYILIKTIAPGCPTEVGRPGFAGLGAAKAVSSGSKRGRNHGIGAAFGDNRRRPDPRPSRTLLHDGPAGPGRARHQGRGAGDRRRRPLLRPVPQRQVGLFHVAQPRQGKHRARPQGAGRPRDLRGAARDGGRAGRELPPGHAREARLWLGRSARAFP